MAAMELRPRVGGPARSPYMAPEMGGGSHQIASPVLLAHPPDAPGGGPADPRYCQAAGDGLSSVIARHAAGFTIT